MATFGLISIAFFCGGGLLQPVAINGESTRRRTTDGRDRTTRVWRGVIATSGKRV
jgi:hypothetical protein